MSPCISGSFWENEEYIVVADRYQKNVYQLKPDAGEVRALPMNPCHPVSVAFDHSVNVLYVICTYNSRYYIQRKTFDGRIDETFYTVPQGTHYTCKETFFQAVHCVEIIT